jgi:DNA helicase-2/ATP-dependent DNA helicase PcrA
MSETLNDEQLAAVNSIAYTTKLPAGPGSGKSRTLAARVKLALARGADPRELMAFTFTTSGARVLQQRIGVPLYYMGTIHGFGMRMIQRHGGLIGYNAGAVKLAPEPIAKEFLMASRERIRPKINDRQLLKPSPDDPPTVKADVDLIRRDCQHALKRSNMVDYDRILIDALRLLRLDQVRASLHLFELLGDEMQDSGPADWDIFWAIYAEQRFIVGDVNQSIYAFRGGAPKLFTMAQGERFPLKLNYRSDVAICEAANRLIRHSPTFAETIPVSQEPGFVGVRGFGHEGEEIYWIWSQICKAMNEGTAFAEIAVLARNNSIVKKYRETLMGLGLPVRRVFKNEWRMDEIEEHDKTGITVCTIHAAKGHEFDLVFLAAMEDGILPHFNGTECATLESELEEETRLTYVAVTRARHKLFISYARQRPAEWGEILVHEPSRFIRDMELPHE